MTRNYNRTEIENALDSGIMLVKMSNSRFWRLRRNGRTQTWVRDPERWRIPIKAGLRAYGELTNENTFGRIGKPGDGPAPWCYYIIESMI